MADMKVSQMGEVLVASDNDLLNLVTYDEQNQTYVSGKVKASTMKEYMIGDTDISGLGDGTPTGAIDALDGKIDDNYDEWKEQWKKNGAYNHLPNNGVTQVAYGLTFTFNPTGYKKGVVHVTGSKSDGTGHAIDMGTSLGDRIFTLKAGTYKILDGVSASNTNLGLELYNYDTSASIKKTYNTHAEIFTLSADTRCICSIGFKGAQDTAFDDYIYPIITTDLNATPADYVPYAKTNRELAEVKVGTVTAESGYSFVTGYDNKAYRSINTVYVNLKVTQFTPSSTAWINIATLPTGFIPTNQVVFPVMDDKQGIAVIGRIDNNGKVYVWGTANTAILPFVNTTYIVS